MDETVFFFPQISGQYQIKVSAFSSGPGMSTSGSFNIVYTANGQRLVTTDPEPARLRRKPTITCQANR